MNDFKKFKTEIESIVMPRSGAKSFIIEKEIWYDESNRDRKTEVLIIDKEGADIQLGISEARLLVEIINQLIS